MRKEFIWDINGSYQTGNLNLSWADKEMTEYIQFKIRESGYLPKKHAVEKPGLQDDGTWILGSGLFLNDKGEEMDPKQIKLCVDKPSTPG